LGAVLLTKMLLSIVSVGPPKIAAAKPVAVLLVIRHDVRRSSY
jgi:hypothetical protein